MTAAPRVFAKYEEIADGCEIDLSDNTNLWGPPPSVQGVLAACEPRDATRYPSAYSNHLKGAISRYTGFEQSMIVTGCGSDDVLDSAIRAFGNPGEVLAQLDPSFSMMRAFASVGGLSVTGVSPEADNLAEAFTESGARLTYLCSPNNPTGGVIPPEVIEAIVAAARGLVIIDEAYIEFGGVSSLGLLERYDNLLITRTLSKAFGLAGFRVGYGVGSPEVVRKVEGARGPYKVAWMSEQVAVAVLDNDVEWATQTAQEAIGNRRRLTAELRKLGCKPLESSANFVLVPVSDSSRVETGMRMRGIAVRRFVRLPGIGDAVRISIGPWPLMERCLDALREAVQ